MSTPYILQLLQDFGFSPAPDKGFVEIHRPVRGRLLRGPRPRAWMSHRIRGTHHIVRLANPSKRRLCK